MYTTVIRGAITVEDNSKEQILINTTLLLKEIIHRNNVSVDDIISILFTATGDLDQAYPAVAAREIGIVHAGLLCMQEMYVQGSLPMCIRVMIHITSPKTQREMDHVYLKEAIRLRPDLSGI